MFKIKSNSLIWVVAGVLLLFLCIAVVPVSAAAPVAAFSGTPTSGPLPLDVAFTESGE